MTWARRGPRNPERGYGEIFRSEPPIFSPSSGQEAHCITDEAGLAAMRARPAHTHDGSSPPRQPKDEMNRPGFDAASFLEEDADHAQQVSRRTAAARDPDGS
jgi:hypothetical protein